MYAMPGFKSAVRVLIVVPFCALIAVIDLISKIVERKNVLRGNFFITTDEIVEREDAHFGPKFQHNKSRNFKFKNYGCHWIQKSVYSPKEDKFISGKEQLNRAYLGDVYYVAITNKNKRIIAAFDTDSYYK